MVTWQLQRCAAGTAGDSMGAGTESAAAPAAELHGEFRPPAVGDGDSQRAQRLSHITNFELERMFALTASPALAAAMRCGGSHAAAAVARMREVMSQRHHNSESYLRMWDEDRSGVITVRDPAEPAGREQTAVEAVAAARALRAAQKARAAKEALRALPEEQLTASTAGDPCAICQDALGVGEAVRRLPCAHVFHSECIARWLRVKLTCPLDSLPVDEGIEMLAAATSTDGAEAEEADRVAARMIQGAARAAPGVALPALSVQQLRAAAESAGVGADALADALGRRRQAGVLTLVE